jgi:hypothetical protein
VSLSGTLDTMSVYELTDWMSRKNATGILTFKRAGITKTMTIESGQVVNAASTDAREYLGQFLINFGVVDEDQLQKAFETQQETKVLLGRILVMTGLAEEKQIHRILELKIRESFLDVFLWDQGNFNFQDGIVPDEPSVVPVSVGLNGLCKEGAARKNFYEEIRTLIPSNACRFVCNQKAIPKDIDPHSANAVMLQLARNEFSAADIILRFHSLDFPILKNLYDMVNHGWLGVTEPTPSTDVEIDVEEILEPEAIDSEASTDPAGPDRYLMSAQGAMQKRDYDQAIGILKRGLVDHPYDPDLCEALEIAESGLVDALRNDMLSDKCVPYLLRDDLLAISSKWTPAQRYILSRIDGQRNLRSIIMVSPLKEVEALKTFRSLIKAGYVALR